MSGCAKRPQALARLPLASAAASCLALLLLRSRAAPLPAVPGLGGVLAALPSPPAAALRCWAATLLTVLQERRMEQKAPQVYSVDAKA